MSEAAAFHYARGIAPMMWAFVGLATTELVVVHFLISFWSPAAALILSLLTLGSIVWLVLLLRSFRRLPVLVTGEGVTMRVGTMRSLHVPRRQIAGVRRNFPSKALKVPGVEDMALIAYPNVIIDLDPPIEKRRRTIGSISHRLEEPDAFARAVEALLARPELPAAPAP